MTELQFQKQILNDKEELIFHFNAITNIFSNGTSVCTQRFDGDVIVNLTNKKYYISKLALTALRDNYASKAFDEYNKANENLDNWNMNVRDSICDEMIEKMLFEKCDKLEDVIC